METKKLKLVGKALLNEAKKKSPEIKAGGALIGLGLTVFFALRAKPKVEKHIKEGKEEVQRILDEAKENGTEGTKEVKKEVLKVRVKTGGKVAVDVAPAAIAAGVTVGCVFGVKKELTDRWTETAIVSDITADNHAKYVEAAKEVVGEKKETEIDEVATKKRIEETYGGTESIIITGKGDVLYYDEWLNTYFRASKSWIENCQNKVNDKLNRMEMYISLNEWADFLGVPHVKHGDEHGFCSDTGLMDIYYTVGEMPGGEHCIVVKYDVSRKYKDTNSMPW